MADFSLLLARRFLPGQITASWTPSTRAIVPAVEASIETAWHQTISRPGVRLFDGTVARLESFDVADDRLHIALSPTRYRILVGTNFSNPHFADTFGDAVMANPLGVSTGLITSDAFWIMGRRNRSVAYYPHRVHPFAGSLEVRAHVDLFDDIRRELREELSLSTAELSRLTFVGLAVDRNLRHPESIFLTQTHLTRQQITAQLDQDEHDGVWFTPATAEATSAAMNDADLTPIARAALLLGGRERFGEEWFAAHAPAGRDN